MDQFKQDCQTIVEAANTAKPGGLIHYAAAYAKAALDWGRDWGKLK